MDKLELIEKAKNAYYNTENPIMSDFEYDKLVAEVGYELVGAPVLDSLKKIDISDKPMLSLAKCHSTEEIIEFAKGQDLVASVKCDGLSVRIIYEDGKIISANTRGNGEVGQDITEHIKQFINVPLIIDYKGKLIVDGEAVILQHDFDEINKNGEFANPRNLAAGTLASLDTSLCHIRRMSFIAWDLIEPKMDFYNGGLNYLQDECGIDIVPWQYCASSLDTFIYENINNKIIKVAKKNGIPCDGVVWKYNFNGYNTERTAHHFKNGIAWKPAIKEYETSLINIEFSLGRTGQLTPVAIYEDVETETSTLNRASLHNISEMTNMLGQYPFVGQKIRVFQANEIIPQLSWAESSENAQKENKKLIKLFSCPVCGRDIEIRDNNGIITAWCANPSCEGKLSQKINHYCSRDKGMDIRGLSLKTIEKLIELGWLNEISDIYNLEKNKKNWCSLAGFGEKSVTNILNAIEKSKECKLENFISALGIPLIGVRVAKEIVKYYPTWDDFMAAIGGKWSDLDGFGPEMEKSLNEFDYTEAKEIAAMLNFKQHEVQSDVTPSAAGITFCITGKVNVWKNRDALKTYIESIGGKVVGSMSSKVNYLINNDNTSTSAKNVAAKKAGIPIITEAEFIDAFGQN